LFTGSILKEIKESGRKKRWRTLLSWLITLAVAQKGFQETGS